MDLAKVLDWLKPGADWIKLAPRYLLAVCLVTSALLFLPTATIQVLGLLAARDAARPWIGGVLLLALALLSAHGVSAAAKWLTTKVAEARFLRRGRKRLHSLTSGENKILHHYIANDSRSQNLAINDGDVRELEAARIIRRAANVSVGDMYFPYNLQPWAWRYLREHPELVRDEPQSIS